jgi:hypothetical protein
MPVTVVLALSRKLRLSPVLGPGGVEAVRLQEEMPASWPIANGPDAQC